MTQQKALTLNDAIELALENNRDIEVTRKTATIAEFDLRAARGFYQPRLIGTDLLRPLDDAERQHLQHNQKTTSRHVARQVALSENVAE